MIRTNFIIALHENWNIPTYSDVYTGLNKTFLKYSAYEYDSYSDHIYGWNIPKITPYILTTLFITKCLDRITVQGNLL